MNDWLSTIHLLGLILWGGSLLGISRHGEVVDAIGRLKTMHVRGAIPGAFIYFFTGVWLTHEEPKVLLDTLFRIRLMTAGGLMVMHTLCVHRFIHGHDPRGARPIFFTTALLLVGCIVLTTLVSSKG